MDSPAIIGPAIAAVVTGAFLVLTNRAIVFWTARQQGRATARQQQDAAAVAKISADEDDRERVSETLKWIVGNLREEVAELRRMVEARNTQLDTLHEDIAQLRVIERQLRAENTTLRQRVAELERQIKPATT